MSLRLVLRRLTTIVVTYAILSTACLYIYPFWYGCAFPSTTTSRYHGFGQTVARHAGYSPDPSDTAVAPFRLLVLADPQLEGDSSLPDPEDTLLARLNAHSLRLRETSLNDLAQKGVEVVKEFVTRDIPRSLQATRKTLDLFGNDYYLAHIYRTLHWWTFPTHVTVLGDLIGSQWVSDEEFQWRAWRYWNRVFAHSHMASDEIMNSYEIKKEDESIHKLHSDDPEGWRNTIINIVGNHDIGYSGDISRSRVDRFEKAFGKVNWDIHFSYPDELLPTPNSTVPTIHFVILNSMSLDNPPLDYYLQGQTFKYIQDLMDQRLDPVESRNSTFTLLLTHVPLYKPEGICVDPPFFDYWDYTEANGAFKEGGLKEQNHLSQLTSHMGVLKALYGMSGFHDAPAGGRGRNGLILNGHDHEGCDVVHYVERGYDKIPSVPPREKVEQRSDGTDPENADQDADNPDQQDSNSDPDSTSDPDPNHRPGGFAWHVMRTPDYPPPPRTHPTTDHEISSSIREITIRSMMGEFGGNAGLLSLWYDFDAKTWQYEIQMCPLGVQHIWWAIHVIDLVAVLMLLGSIGFWVGDLLRAVGGENGMRKGREMSLGRRGNEKEVVSGAGRHTSVVDRGHLGFTSVRHDVGSSSSSSVIRSGSQRRRKG